MADKITVYVDSEFHRQIKTAASAQGMSLSDFMVRAVQRAMHTPDRKAAARQMDRVRALAAGSTTQEEIRTMRDQGRRF